MQFRGDRRGQAIQIGAVLLLGAIVIAFGIYQATVVPEQNREIEFKHSQTVQDQLGDARNAIVSTGQTGEGRSISVTLGTQYPSRVIALNPGSPSGSLSTVGTADGSTTATIVNANATGETGDFWTGTNQSYNTGAVTYRPGYNEYANAPTTWYEHSVLFNEFQDANLTTTGQRLVADNTISLVTLNGSYQASRSGDVSLDFRAVSTSTRTVTVTNATADSNVSVTLPTRLDEQNWEELLAEEIASGHVSSVTTDPVSNKEYSQLRLVFDRFDDGQQMYYELDLARVGIGTQVVRPDAAYLTDVAGYGSTVPEGGTTRLTVEVRDKLNNPVQDTRVVAGTERNDSAVSSNRLVSNNDGRVSVTYDAPNITGESQITDYVQFSLDPSLMTAVNASGFNGSTPINVSVPVYVDNSDGSGLGGGQATYQTNWQYSAITNEDGIRDCFESNETCVYDLGQDPDGTVNFTVGTTPTATSAFIDFTLNNSLGTLSPSTSSTDTSGQAVTAFSPSSVGRTNLSALSTESDDIVTLVVVDTGTGGPMITNPTAEDLSDSDGVVNDGDTVSVSATVTSNQSISNVTADVSEFGGPSSLSLNNTSGDTYEASFTVNGAGTTDGSYPIPITATDGNGSTNTATTNSLELDTTAPTITSATLASDNSYVDIAFSEGVYTDSGGTSGLTVSDFEYTFSRNSGDGTDITIDSVTDTSGTALSGGETTVRVQISVIDGPASGVEEITMRPADGSAIYDASGNGMADSESTGTLPLNDLTAPTLDSVSRVDDTTISVALSDSGSGLDRSTISAGDFALSEGSIDSIDSSSISNGDTSGTVTITLAGPVDSDTVTVSLQTDGIDDMAGNTQTSGSGTATGMDGVAPTIPNATLANDNSYVEIEFSEGVYTDSAGTTALTASDFEYTFTQNGGDATSITIDNVTDTSGSTLSGGETTVRAQITVVNGPASGVEEIVMSPADGSAIYDASGNGMADGESTGTLTLNDRRPPTISDFTLTNPTGKDLKTDFNSSESLSEVQVSTTGGESITLTIGDFTETQNPDGSYTYTNTTTGVAPGDYEAALNVARDAAGNDGASGQIDTATVPSSADSVQLVTGSPSKSGESSSTVQFSLENTGALDTTIHNITVVNADNADAAEIGNGSKVQGAYSDDGPEFVSGQDGTLLNTTSPFPVGSTQSITDTILAAGTQDDYYLAEFRKPQSNKEVNPNAFVTIRFGFADGSTKEIRLDL